jgi:hypothetical protein
MKLIDGGIKIFSGTNWKLVGDKKWVDHEAEYLANGYEEYLGDRQINSELHCVFKLCDDDFGAQPKSKLSS